MRRLNRAMARRHALRCLQALYRRELEYIQARNRAVSSARALYQREIKHVFVLDLYRFGRTHTGARPC
jgi:hypothetical protein